MQRYVTIVEILYTSNAMYSLNTKIIGQSCVNGKFLNTNVILLKYFSRYILIKCVILFESGGHNSKIGDNLGVITFVSISQAKY